VNRRPGWSAVTQQPPAQQVCQRFILDRTDHLPPGMPKRGQNLTFRCGRDFAAWVGLTPK